MIFQSRIVLAYLLFSFLLLVGKNSAIIKALPGFIAPDNYYSATQTTPKLTFTPVPISTFLLQANEKVVYIPDTATHPSLGQLLLAKVSAWFVPIVIHFIIVTGWLLTKVPIGNSDVGNTLRTFGLPIGLALLGFVAAPILRRWRTWLLLATRGSLRRLWVSNELSWPLLFGNGLRLLAVVCALGLALLLFVHPERGLYLFWQLFIPLLPFLFFLVPTLWYSLYPVMLLNPASSLLSLAEGWAMPKRKERDSYVLGISLFAMLVCSRKALFNEDGAALAILILCSLTSAFVLVSFFKGKNRRYSSNRLPLPVQRDNDYDQLTRLHKAFVGLLPGFVMVYYLLPQAPAIAIWQMGVAFGVAAGISSASFFIVERLTGTSSKTLTALYGAATLNLYYWFNSASLGLLFASPAPEWFTWPLRTLIFILTLHWLYQTYQREQPFSAYAGQTTKGDTLTLCSNHCTTLSKD